MTASLPQPLRLREGGLINRNRPLTFTFDRRVYQGYEGDSLASALLASGVKPVSYTHLTLPTNREV